MITTRSPEKAGFVYFQIQYRYFMNLDLCTYSLIQNLCLYYVRTFTRLWQRRDSVGNYSNIFAIISKYLHRPTQPYFTLSDGRRHQETLIPHKVMCIQFVFVR